MRVQQMKAMKQQQAQAEYQRAYLLYQQQQAPQEAPQTPEQTYQQKVEQRNQAIAQAIHDTHMQSASSSNTQARDTARGPQVPQQDLTSGASKPKAPSPSAQVKDVVDLSEVWKKLDEKSVVWPLIIDDQAKIMTVSEFLDRFRRQGVKINAPPMHYVELLDQMAKDNPQILERPFGELLQMLAIIDYDFDNGMNKDDLARHVLGEAGFQENKKRFSK